jgi:methylenetetrahydrofolate reductase (NADPH)
MKVSEIIQKSQKPLFTFELLPPLKGGNIEKLYNTIDNLLEFEPAYVNITYHQHEIEYVERNDGLLEKKIVQKRPGTVAIASAIMHKYKLTVVPHLICGGFTKEETEDALIDLSFLGMDNILALRGDPVKGQKRFKPEKGGHAYASELVKQIVDMNNGKYLNPGIKHQLASNFCVGVAGYPEKHYESPNLEEDIYWLRHKVNKGAEYIVTQMFFDNSVFFNFVRKCREAEINVPIIPGLKPISAFNDIKLLPSSFHLNIPYELCKEVQRCKTRDQVKQVGVEWSISQSKELIKFGVPGLHFFTLGQSDNIRKIASEVY